MMKKIIFLLLALLLVGGCIADSDSSAVNWVRNTNYPDPCSGDNNFLVGIGDDLNCMIVTGGGVGGGSYTGIAPIVVDNDTNKIGLNVSPGDDWNGLFDGFEAFEFVLATIFNASFPVNDANTLGVDHLIEGSNITLSCTGSDGNGTCTVNSSGGGVTWEQINESLVPIADVNIDFGTGAGQVSAVDIPVDVTNFDNVLSASDSNVKLALETIDDNTYTQETIDSLIAGSNFDFFLSDTADGGIGGYNIMFDAETGEAQSTVVQSVSADGDTIQVFITESDQPAFNVLSEGVYAFHFHAEVDVVNPSTKEVEVFFELYKRASGGAETLIMTSENSSTLTTSEIEYEVHGSLAVEQMLLDDDRLVLKVLANIDNTSPPNNPSVTITMEGTTASRFTVKTNISAFDSRYNLTKDSNNTARLLYQVIADPPFIPSTAEWDANYLVNVWNFDFNGNWLDLLTGQDISLLTNDSGYLTSAAGGFYFAGANLILGDGNVFQVNDANLISANSLLVSGDNISELTNNSGYITSFWNCDGNSNCTLTGDITGAIGYQPDTNAFTDCSVTQVLVGATGCTNTPTLTATNITGVPAASILAGTFGGSTAYTIPQNLIINGTTTSKGTLIVGVNDTTQGFGIFYGGATGTDFGGVARFYNPVDHQATNEFWQIYTRSDTLRLGSSSSGDVLTLDSSLKATFAGAIQSVSIGVGVAPNPDARLIAGLGTEWGSNNYGASIAATGIGRNNAIAILSAGGNLPWAIANIAGGDKLTIAAMPELGDSVTVPIRIVTFDRSDLSSVFEGTISSTGTINTVAQFEIDNINVLNSTGGRLLIGQGAGISSSTEIYSGGGVLSVTFNSSNNAIFEGTISSKAITITDTAAVVTLKIENLQASSQAVLQLSNPTQSWTILTEVNDALRFNDGTRNIMSITPGGELLSFVIAPGEVRINVRGDLGNDVDFAVEDSSGNTYLHADSGLGFVGVGTTVPAGKLHVDQSSDSAAIPVLVLDQADISEGFINFIGSARGIIPVASSVQSVRVELNGTVYRLALYPDA